MINSISTIGHVARSRKTRRTLFIALALAVVPLTASVIGQAPGAAASVNPDTLKPTVTSAYCGHGISAVSVTPARGFNPLTATAAELEANGYPARPAASRAPDVATWRTFVARHKAEKSACNSFRPSDISHQASVSPPVTESSASTNWAGYEAGNATYTDIEAQWELPPIAKTTNVIADSASWVGIGTGTNSQSALVQAGSESDMFSSLANNYSLWFEVYPEEASQQLKVAVKATDLVGVRITDGPHQQYGCNNVDCTSYATCTAATCALIHIWDPARNFDESYEVGGDWSNQGHVEWIYERPCDTSQPKSSCLPYLADAAPDFSQAEAVIAGAWYPLGKLGSGSGTGTSVDDIRMTDCKGTTVLAAPGQAYSSTFGVTWDAYGDDYDC